MPKEPRQLMINLMYLVLTAMLALNVSSEILHAFKTINQSIGQSNLSITEKNAQLYRSFDDIENQEGQRDRVKPFNDKAKEVKAAADAAYNYLQDWKERVINQAGGYDDEAKTVIKKQDDIDASTFLLVEKGGGDSIKNELLALRQLMLSKVTQDRDDLANQLPIRIVEPERSDNNPNADWKVGYFFNMPVMATVTLLSKFQNDIKNSEAMVLSQLMKEAGDIQVKFDAIEAIAVPKTSYALAGQKVEASIMLAAYNKAVNPEVTASSGRVVTVENGVAQWETVASGVGLQTVRGTVSIDLGGRRESKDYEFQYMVGSTGASIQLDKMNVFYIGVPNPITVTAAGYSLEDVYVNIPGAEVVPNPEVKGKFDVMVEKPGTVTAEIMARTNEGGPKQVGSMDLRVKFIPDPVAKVANRTGGSIPSNQFKVQKGIIAVLDGFDFDARFQVTEYSFSMLPRRGELIGPYQVNSPYLDRNPEVKAAIERARPGDRIYIEEIKGVGPDKRRRSLNSITLLLN